MDEDESFKSTSHLLRDESFKSGAQSPTVTSKLLGSGSFKRKIADSSTESFKRPNLSDSAFVHGFEHGLRCAVVITALMILLVLFQFVFPWQPLPPPPPLPPVPPCDARCAISATQL